MDSQAITMEQLHKIRKSEPLVLEEKPGKKINMPILWLFYDFDTSSYILVRRTYDDNKVRNFNHVILDDIFLEDHADQVPEIIKEAIEKIKGGKCLVFQPNKTFTVAQCSKPHK